VTPAHARDVVAAVGWLSRQAADFRSRFLEEAELREVSAGATVNSLGDAPGGLYGVVDGFLDVLIAPGPFPPTLVYIARRGWWVGEAALITRTTRRVAMIARTDALLLCVPERVVLRLTQEEPEIWRRLAQITVSHLDNALLLAASLSSSDLRLRLAATLYRVAGPSALSDPIEALPVTREEIGEIAGLSRNTAGRLLADLAREGLVEMRYGRVVIKDADALNALLHV
jgi:CRP/FNR family cyclic AMP-dependent transcriptional regulator